MSRIVKLEELNNRIDEAIAEYVQELKETTGDVQFKVVEGKIKALEEFKIDINEPHAFIDVSEKVQESLNVNSAQNIVNNGM